MRVLFLFLLVLFVNSCMSDECTGLNEADCQANDLCTDEQGPSLCSGDVCTGDIVFKGCRQATEEEKSKRKKMQKVKASFKLKCTASQGQWRERNGECICGERRFFLRTEGCTTLQKVCREAGGTYYPVGKFECNDKMREEHTYYCPKGFRYGKKPKYTHNISELCWCRSGQPWDRNKQKCL